MSRLSLSNLFVLPILLLQNGKATELAPLRNHFEPNCRCDVTPNCDWGCCCDQGCGSSTKTALFGCSENYDVTSLGIGGVSSTFMGRFLFCSRQNVYDSVQQKFEFGLLCIERSLTPLLGRFFPEKVSSGAVEMKHSFAELLTTESSNSRSKIERDYARGVSIKWADGGFIQFPHRILDSKCSWKAPLRLLVNSATICTTRLSRTNCQGDNRAISLFTYSTDPQQIRRRGSTAAETLKPNIELWCGIEQSEKKSRENGRNRLIDNWFDSGNLTPQSRRFERCASQKVTTPLLNKESGKCEHTVREVNYKFRWSASIVDKQKTEPPIEKTGSNTTVLIEPEEKQAAIGGLVSLTILLFVEDVLIEQNGSDVEQRFKVEWSRDEANEQINNDPVVQLLDPNSRRMNRSNAAADQGYTFGLPISGANEDEQGAIKIDSDESNILVWKTDATTLCEFATKKPLLFGRNTSSACFVHITKSSFENCSAMKHKIYAGLESLVPVKLLSRFGNVKRLQREYYVPLIRQQTDLATEQNQTATEREEETDESGECCRVPNHLGLDILYTTVRQNSRLTMEIVGSYLYYKSTTWYYGDHGQPSNKFMLSSSYNFYQVSPPPSATTRRHELQRKRFHCPSYVTCWDELFYPFTRETETHSQSVVLLFVTICLGYVILIYLLYGNFRL